MKKETKSALLERAYENNQRYFEGLKRNVKIQRSNIMIILRCKTLDEQQIERLNCLLVKNNLLAMKVESSEKVFVIFTELKEIFGKLHDQFYEEINSVDTTGLEELEEPEEFEEPELE